MTDPRLATLSTMREEDFLYEDVNNLLRVMERQFLTTEGTQIPDNVVSRAFFRLADRVGFKTELKLKDHA